MTTRTHLAVGGLAVALTAALVLPVCVNRLHRTELREVQQLKTDRHDDVSSYEWAGNDSIVCRNLSPSQTPTGATWCLCRIAVGTGQRELLRMAPMHHMDQVWFADVDATEYAVSPDGTRLLRLGDAPGKQIACMTDMAGRTLATWELPARMAAAGMYGAYEIATIAWLPDGRHWAYMAREPMTLGEYPSSIATASCGALTADKPASARFVLRPVAGSNGYNHTLLIPTSADAVTVLTVRNPPPSTIPSPYATTQPTSSLSLAEYEQHSGAVPVRTQQWRLPVQGEILAARVSPSGQRIACIATAEAGATTWRQRLAGKGVIWVGGSGSQTLAKVAEVSLNGSAPARLRFSPNEQMLGFVIDQHLCLVNVRPRR